MAPKTTSNKWSDVQLAIAAISMTSVLAFWNMFAGPDRIKADAKAAAEQQAALIPTATPFIVNPPATPMPTMPPPGYTILFGGKAPQPQVIVVQQPRGGGNGGNQDQGGGNSSPAVSAPVTSSGSS
ncbi:MAG: hypothetical protein U0V02_22205 [Anaerolineales bacterium]